MPRSPLDVTRDQVLDLYEMGRLPSQIAKDLCIAQALVSRCLGALRNAKVLPKAKEDHQLKGWIVERAKAGKGPTTISREIGLNPSYVEEMIQSFRLTGDLPLPEDGGADDVQHPAIRPLSLEEERVFLSLRERGESETRAMAGMRSYFASRARRQINATSRAAMAA
ncbi:hypothetical protein EOD42_14275 [Rhodovarius crocodyli]|uniref:Uncharacterized protein n=1 Tax=Rhodovarius crocodyli TaxID=1979269 RepID=A0A437MF78_9PROT|nr:hypothetical protein [Rhodovarius crocodyli]RVT96275.1 hypothetical protein EOD42_14275 [Rhodovarius crocodyli]